MRFGWISSLYYYIKIYLYLFIKNEKRENLQYLDGQVYTLKNIPSYALNCYENILETKPNLRVAAPVFFITSYEGYNYVLVSTSLEVIKQTMSAYKGNDIKGLLAEFPISFKIE